MLATLAPWIMPGLAIMGLADWLRTRATISLKLDDSAERHARQKAHAWQRAALFLFGCAVVLRCWGEPAHTWLDFCVTPPGFAWLVLAWLCGPLLAAGSDWAERAGGDPFPVRLRPTRRAWRAWPWLWLGGWLAVMLGATALLAGMEAARPAVDVAARLGIGGLPAWRAAAVALALLTLAPILEEILFRHYLLYRVMGMIARGAGEQVSASGAARSVAAIVSAVLFGLAHAPLLEPWWLKVMQAGAMGLVLAVTALRYGLEPAIGLHWAFNLGLFAMMLARG